MLEYFYRKDDQEIFSGRKNELSLMDEHLFSGKPVDVHISGLRRIGKTMLIKEFMKRHMDDEGVLPVYINLEEISETPEDFALKFIGWHVYWYYTKGSRLPVTYLHLPSLIFEIQDKELRDALMPVTAELEKAKPDRQRLLQECFNFSGTLARFTGKRVIVSLDEFQEIVNLTNFDQMKNILKIFRSVKDRVDHVTYCISGSIISEMENITRDSASPLFNQFSHLPIKPYTREESGELINKFIPDVDNRLTGLFHYYSTGNPFYLVRILRKAILFLDRGEVLSDMLVKRAFISEVLSPGGLIHSYCTYLYNVSLQRARGYGVLKSLLDIVATNDTPMTQSELARALKMSQGPIRINLKALQDIGLLFEKERKYYYFDPILKYWVAYVQNGVEVSDFPKEKDLMSIIEELDKKYQRVSEELGRMKEESVMNIMKQFSGQEIDGALFGLTERIILPGFTKLKRYISTDGKIEIDILAITKKGKWAVEVKWKGKAAGLKEIERFLKKALPLADTYWYVSKAGFTKEARQFALEKRIFISSEKDIGVLVESLQQG
ncbi:MAG: ATP-binding protein [Proteobacteria bacterium]|nr:ATP-binding protein [Pseudomonadota bacterium]